MKNSIRKIIILSAFLLVVSLASSIDSIAKSYKNKLLNIRVSNTSSKSAQLTLFTENLYNLKLNPIKKDSNKYVIFLPGTIESLKNKTSLANARGTIDDIQVQFVPLLGSNDSYTKIIVTTSNQNVSLNLKNRVIKKAAKKKIAKRESVAPSPKINNNAIAKASTTNTTLPKRTEIAKSAKKPITQEIVVHDLPLRDEKPELPVAVEKAKEKNIKIVKIKDTKQEAKNKEFFDLFILVFLISLAIAALLFLKSIFKKRQSNYVSEIDKSFDNIDKKPKEDMFEKEEVEVHAPPAPITESINILDHLTKYDYVLLIDSNSNYIQKMAHYLAKNEINLLLAGNDRDKLKEIAQQVTIQYNVNVKIYDFNITEFYKHKSFYKSLEHKPAGVIFDIDYKGDTGKLSDNNNFVEVKKVIDTNFTNYISIGNIIVEELIKNDKGFIGFIKDNSIQDIEKHDYIYLSSKLAILSYISGLQAKFSNRPVKIFSLDPQSFDEVQRREQEKREKIAEKTKAIASLF